MNTQRLEFLVAKFFGIRENLIVPNVWWGLGLPYEADLVVVSPFGYATEIELKVSASDIKAETKKARCAHRSNKFKLFYYAVPEELEKCEYLPKDRGVISVGERGKRSQCCKIIRPSRVNTAAGKLSEKEIATLYRLAAMRVWTLKERLVKP